jgi:hypothetical protein
MKYSLACLLCVQCAFAASVIQGGATKSVLCAPPHYSFDDAQLLYHWTFDGPDIAWTASGWTQTARVGSSATMLASGQDSGSFITAQNNYMRPGVAGQCEYWPGSNNGAQGRVTNLNLSAVSLMTISLWLKPAYVLTWNGDKMLIEGGVANSNTQTNAIVLDTGSGARDFTIAIRDFADASKFISKTFKNTNGFPTSNLWYHCAFVFDNTTVAGNVKAYINAAAVSLSAQTSTKTAAGNFGNHFWSFFNRGSLNLPLPSTAVDDLRIYTNELTQAQVSEIYTNTAQWVNAP